MQKIKISQNNEQFQTKFFITSICDSIVNNKYLFLIIIYNYFMMDLIFEN